ncbi:MAG: glycosyltransferase, partial [Betaproteobacteria bacterium]|nr:glycosyltransferase [Betaproteobacteria bacterium]
RLLLLSEEQGHGGVHTALGLLRTALAAQGWQVHTCSVRAGRPGWLALLAQAHQADVLVASNNFQPAYWTVLLGLMVQRPSVVWVHGPLAEVLAAQPVSWPRRLLLQWTYRLASALVFASRTSQLSLQGLVPTEALPPQTVVHNPAPAETPAPAAALPHAGMALGFVGRLSAEKCPERLLHMMALLPQTCQLTLVGDGPLRPALERQAQALGLLGDAQHPPRVHFAGAQQVTPATYQAWQATVLCSAYEGYPLVALESLAAGVPCIGTPLPALQEMLGPWVPAWIAPSTDPAALALTVQQALHTDADTRQRQALAVARLHPQASFGAQWHALLLRSLGQPLPGPKTVHFVHTGPAYMPELAAYEAFLAQLGHHSVVHRDPASVPQNADIVWWLCGRVNGAHAHRLRHSVQVHEYASASVGRWPRLKDHIKRWSQPRPQHRVFLNPWVRERLGFDDGVPSVLRDMGVPADFLRAHRRAEPEFDLVYLGEMGRLLACEDRLRTLMQAGLSLLLVGDVPPALQALVQDWPRVHCCARVPQTQVPAQLLRARAGLNLMPEHLPFTEQTSTKVLEYLAVGLPVLSNRYAWAEHIAAQYPERVRLLDASAQAEDWRLALQEAPPLQLDRSGLRMLAWPERLAHLPIWAALGLTGAPP